MDREFTDLQKRIDALFKSIDDAYDRVARAQGIPSSTQDILYALLVYGEPLTQKQICDYSYSNKQTINSAIHRLAGQGILHMEPGAGRSTLVSLTGEGRALAERTVAPVALVEQQALAAIPEETREQLMDAMADYAASLADGLAQVASSAQAQEGE